MIFFTTKKSNGKNARSGTVSLASECTVVADGFKCRPGGKTPLAGATYKKIKFGRSKNSCEEKNVLGEKYICTEGCGGPVVPEYLEGDDGSC